MIEKDSPVVFRICEHVYAEDNRTTHTYLDSFITLVNPGD